jgi:hypothetical protein
MFRRALLSIIAEAILSWLWFSFSSAFRRLASLESPSSAIVKRFNKHLMTSAVSLVWLSLPVNYIVGTLFPLWILLSCVCHNGGNRMHVAYASLGPLCDVGLSISLKVIVSSQAWLVVLHFANGMCSRSSSSLMCYTNDRNLFSDGSLQLRSVVSSFSSLT